MGCIFSKNGQIKTLTDDLEEPLPASAFSTRGAAHAWLQEIGLPQYAESFENAGFSDWDLLSCLTETDLDAITAHTGTVIPPGHRKKLLIASRQMGTKEAQGALGPPPPCGSARRYSHSSNPGNGNGSRGGGLSAAAAAALDRRSAGLRPSSTSRMPSLASIPAGHAGLGHPPQQLLPLVSVQSRNATEDGLVSGRRSRGAGILVTSSNSSRNSLSAVAAAHAIGYIASPSITTPQEIGGGQCDTWVAADGRRSPTEPASPASSAATPARPSGPTPRSQRRRWSANKFVPRGVLVGGNSVSGAPHSASMYGWAEPEAGSLVIMSGAGPIVDDVRQLSVVSSICDVYDVGPGGGGGGALLQPCISRDLDSLVMGASDATNRIQAPRFQLAATRPDKSYGGGGGGNVSGRPPSPPQPPHRISGGQASPVISSGGGGGGLQASPNIPLESPYTRDSLHLSGAPQGVQQQGQASRQSVSHPNLDGYGQQQTQSMQPRIASARDGAAAASATTASASGISPQSLSAQRPGSAAADSTLRSWANSVPSPQLCGRPSTGPSATIGNVAQTSAGVAWASQGEAVSNSAATVTSANAMRSVNRDSGLPGSLNLRSAGNHGGALPKFVRALAGWAIPTHGSGAVGAGSDAAVGNPGASVHGTPSVSGQSRGYTRRSMPQLSRPRTRSGTALLAAGKVLEPGQDAERPVAGDVLAAPAPSAVRSSVSVPYESAMAEPLLRKGPDRGRSQRQMMAPDVNTPRGPWNQDAALCIQGRGYKPASPMPPGHGPGMRTPAAVVTARGSYAAGEEDSDTASSPSHHANGVPVLGTSHSASRGGGWPFVMPQLPQPTRFTNNDVTGMHHPAQSAIRDPDVGSGGGESAINGVRFSTPSILANPHSVPAAAGELVSVPGSANTQSVALGVIPKVYPVHEPLSSMLLESLVGDASSDTAVRRGPPMHSSRPRDWCLNASGESEDAAAERNSGINPRESSADDLVRHGSSALGSQRIQNMVQLSSEAATLSGGAEAGGVSFHSGVAATTATHWPARPLQPPTRSRPPQLLHGAAVSGGGGADDLCQRMEVLPPEAPGPSRVGRVPPGGPAAGGGPPRPTNGRKLDLEMLAEQVARIMSHLSYITKDEADSDVDTSTGETQATVGTTLTTAQAVAVTAVDDEGDRGGIAKGRYERDGGKSAAPPVGVRAAAQGGPVPDAAVAATSATPGSTATGGSFKAQAGSRRQAIDQKRLELERLHVDLVRRVAAMEADPQPNPPPESASGGYGGARSASPVEDVSAADMLAEVEARIRTKLSELAALTMRPASERRAFRFAEAAAPVAAQVDGGGGNGGLSGLAKKRALGSDTGSHGDKGKHHGVSDRDGPGYGHRRAHEEAALHMEVLAVLGARKRQVRGAVAMEPGCPNDNGSDEDGRLRPPFRPPPDQAVRRAVSPQQHPPTAASRTGATMVDHQSGAGAGGLRAELIAIDNKIKAQLRGSGSAFSRRA